MGFTLMHAPEGTLAAVVLVAPPDNLVQRARSSSADFRTSFLQGEKRRDRIQDSLGGVGRKGL